MKIIPPAMFRAMPWKNGGGITHEIARDGEGDDFAWRLSIADVSASGPFSLFPMHQRILVVLSGAGMRLIGHNEAVQALPLDPVTFSGALDIYGELLDGACRDFNLMFDHKRISAGLKVWRCGSSEAQLQDADNIAGIYVVGGSALSLGAVVPAGHFAFFEDGERAIRLEADATVLCITLNHVGKTP